MSVSGTEHAPELSAVSVPVDDEGRGSLLVMVSGTQTNEEDAPDVAGPAEPPERSELLTPSEAEPGASPSLSFSGDLCPYALGGMVRDFGEEEFYLPERLQSISSLEDETPLEGDPAEAVAEDSLEEEPPPYTHRQSVLPKYNKPESAEVVKSIHGEETDESGLIWHANVLPDHYKGECDDKGILKPRRPTPHVRSSDFFGSLVAVDGRWYFSGVLNGWPGLTNLEVVAITSRTRLRLKYHWQSKNCGLVPPAFPSKKNGKPIKGSIRVTLRGPAWSSKGWTQESRGHVFWFAHQRAEGPRLTFGQDAVRAVLLDSQQSGRSIPRAVKVHAFAHRYGKKKESAKDKLLYHAILLVEWDHGKHMTVIESAWFNGLGGYAGRSNWYADRDSTRCALYAAMPSAMKAPWHSGRAEIRMLDVPSRTVEEFQAYLNEYAGPNKRFVDAQLYASGRVCLSLNQQDHILSYLINYLGWDGSYQEDHRNCQTFVADLYGWLTGQKSVPFHVVCRVRYKSQRHTFAYKPHSIEPSRQRLSKSKGQKSSCGGTAL